MAVTQWPIGHETETHDNLTLTMKCAKMMKGRLTANSDLLLKQYSVKVLGEKENKNAIAIEGKTGKEISLVEVKKWKSLCLETPSDSNDKNETTKSTESNGNSQQTSASTTPCDKGGGMVGGHGSSGGGGGDGDGEGDGDQWIKDVPEDGVVRPKIKTKKENGSGDADCNVDDDETDHRDIEEGRALECLGLAQDDNSEDSYQARMVINICIKRLVHGIFVSDCYLCVVLFGMMGHLCECQNQICDSCHDVYVLMVHHVRVCAPRNGFTCPLCLRLGSKDINVLDPDQKLRFLSDVKVFLGRVLGLAKPLPTAGVDAITEQMGNLVLSGNGVLSSYKRRKPSSLGPIPEDSTSHPSTEPSSESITGRRVEDVPGSPGLRSVRPKRPGSLGISRRRSLPVNQSERTWRGIGCVDYGMPNHISRVAKQWTYFKAEVAKGLIIDDCHNGIILAQFREMIVLSHSEGLGSEDLASVVSVGGQRNGQYREGEHYVVIRFLGSGTSGQCYLCQDLTTGFQFCRKEMHLSRYKEDELLLWIRLSHPGIVKLYGAFSTGTNINLLMEYMDGGSLQNLVDKQHKLSVKQSLIFLKRILEALSYLHSKQVVHEDLKGDNVLLSDGNLRLALADFGVSQYLEEGKEINRHEGTECYNAPEIYTGKHGFGVDVWAAICEFVNMTSGQPPWKSRYQGRAGTLAFVIGDSSPPFQDVPSDLDPEVLDLIKQGWLDKSERPSALELLNHPAFQVLEDPTYESIRAQSILYSGLDEEEDADDEEESSDEDFSPGQLLEMVLPQTSHELEDNVDLTRSQSASTDESTSERMTTSTEGSGTVASEYSQHEQEHDGGMTSSVSPVIPCTVFDQSDDEEGVDEVEVKRSSPLNVIGGGGALRLPASHIQESKSLPTPVNKQVMIQQKANSDPPGGSKKADDSGYSPSTKNPNSTNFVQPNVKESDHSSGSIGAYCGSPKNSLKVSGFSFEEGKPDSLDGSKEPFQFPRTSTPTAIVDETPPKAGTTPPRGQNSINPSPGTSPLDGRNRPEYVRGNSSKSKADEDHMQLVQELLLNGDHTLEQRQAMLQNLDDCRGPPQRSISEVSMATMHFPSDQWQGQMPNKSRNESEIEGVTEEELEMFKSIVVTTPSPAGKKVPKKVFFVNREGRKYAKVAISNPQSTFKDVITLARSPIFGSLGKFICHLCSGIDIKLEDAIGSKELSILCRPWNAGDDWFADERGVHIDNQRGHFTMNFDDFSF